MGAMHSIAASAIVATLPAVTSPVFVAAAMSADAPFETALRFALLGLLFAGIVTIPTGFLIAFPITIGLRLALRAARARRPGAYILTGAAIAAGIQTLLTATMFGFHPNTVFWIGAQAATGALAGLGMWALTAAREWPETV
jgi:hypothetical protein